MTNRKITLRYLPNTLTKKDRKMQYGMLVKSRRLYKKGKYFTRKPLTSYKSKTSKHIKNARHLYKIENMDITNNLVKVTGCSKEALRDIVRKGEGAY
jgi:hypothetical protein